MKTVKTTIKKLIKSFPHEQLKEALLYTEDILDRALVPFIVLGKMATQLRDQELPVFEADRIQIAVLERYLSDSPISIMKMVNPNMVWGEDTIRFTYSDVPVEIKIIRQNYEFFKNPDFRMYSLSSFNIPNPFEKYWKMRSLIR